MKVVLAFLHYGPYHRARLAAARRAGFTTGVTVIGLEMAHAQDEYAWTGPGMEVEDTLLCASPAAPLEKVPPTAWSTLLSPILKRVSPDLCAIAGYSHPAMLSLIAQCTQRGIPWILMSDSQEIDEVRKPWREWIKSRLVRLASAGLAAGKPQRAYLAQLGLPADDCEVGYDVVDNEYFAKEAAKARHPDQFPPPYFLASARFIEKKNLFSLLNAYAQYAQYAQPKTSGKSEIPHPKSEIRNPQSPIQNPLPLVLLGDGELREALRQHAFSLGLNVVERAPWEPENSNLKSETASAAAAVFLPGFRQIDELPRFYAGAAAFVHVSLVEQWGLVVNEAMACGLPVLVSNRCGCVPDLVLEGENGWTFAPQDLPGLAALMSKVAALPEEDRAALGAASERLIADWGPERFASGLLKAASRAIEVGPKRGSTLDRLLLKLLMRR